MYYTIGTFSPADIAEAKSLGGVVEEIDWRTKISFSTQELYERWTESCVRRDPKNWSTAMKIESLCPKTN